MAGGEFDYAEVGHRAVGIHHFVIGVGKQPEVKALLGAELLVGIDGVAADTEDDSVAFGVLRLVHLKLVGFAGSTRGLVFGIEVEDDPLASVVLEADRGTVLGWESEVWGGESRSRGGGAGEKARHQEDGCEDHHDQQDDFQHGPPRVRLQRTSAAKAANLRQPYGTTKVVPLPFPRGRQRRQQIDRRFATRNDNVTLRAALSDETMNTELAAWNEPYRPR